MASRRVWFAALIAVGIPFKLPIIRILHPLVLVAAAFSIVHYASPRWQAVSFLPGTENDGTTLLFGNQFPFAKEWLDAAGGCSLAGNRA